MMSQEFAIASVAYDSKVTTTLGTSALARPSEHRQLDRDVHLGITMNIDINAIRSAMLTVVRDCVEGCTGEVNHTLLAKTVADELNLYEDDDEWTIPVEVFDLALDVGEEFERGRRWRAPR